MRIRQAVIAITAVTLAIPAFTQQKLQHRKKHSNDRSTDYQVGIFKMTESADTGSFMSCDHGCVTKNTTHNVHYAETQEGLYVIESPISSGMSLLQGMLVSPELPDVHIQWFMDDLHEGDKVLFAVDCNKHNNCTFWLSKPDQPGKKYHTNGWFRPRVAVTNTKVLCGKGKLKPEVESQVCPAWQQ